MKGEEGVGRDIYQVTRRNGSAIDLVDGLVEISRVTKGGPAGDVLERVGGWSVRTRGPVTQGARSEGETGAGRRGESTKEGRSQARARGTCVALRNN